jgi:long-chain acyl-CoA synthetase
MTSEVIDSEGWFHTGDIGEVDREGFLRITDRKKDLFKLSTGKYVVPTPIESRLLKEPLVDQAVVVGAGQKYCVALVFPNPDTLRQWASEQGINGDRSYDDLVRDPRVVSEFERLVNRANEGIESWNAVKRFRIMPGSLTVENELLTPTMKVKRSKVQLAFNRDIDAMYIADAGDDIGRATAVP